MAEDNTLTKALVDVRTRRAALQSHYDQIATELTKLRAAEAALTSIVEGVPLDETDHLRSSNTARASASDRDEPQRGGRRGPRGPRTNSAKGRLQALLGGSGPQGLSHAEIAERLPDVTPNTLNTYLSMMVTGGDVIRKGDFFTAKMDSNWTPKDTNREADPAENDSADEATDREADAAE